MIRVFFQGGLGNQMFQYAVGRCLAEKNKTDLCLDASWYHYPVQRTFGLLHFNIVTPVVKSKLSFLSHMAFKTPGFGWRYSQVYRELYGPVDLSVFSLPDNSFLIGGFQSEKYFKDIEIMIRRDFSFDHIPMSDETSNIVERIQAGNSVAMHVRRGDYLSHPEFNVCSMGYYLRAVRFMQDRMDAPTFYIFSDDPEWCRATFRGKEFVVVDTMQSKTNPLNDMRMIASCTHAIIANSSYSWWGAWLNVNGDAGRIVVSPDRWRNFGLDGTDTPCSSWVRMSTVDALMEEALDG